MILIVFVVKKYLLNTIYDIFKTKGNNLKVPTKQDEFSEFKAGNPFNQSNPI